MYEIFMIVYLVVALALVGFILIQQGKGAGMGSSFGSGASGTVFGASGSGNFLTKTTTILAVVFFGVALGLGNLTSNKSNAPEEDSLFSEEAMEKMPANEKTDLPETELPTETSSDLPATSTSGDLPTENTAGDSSNVNEIPVLEDTEDTEDKPEPSEDTDNK